VDNYKNVNVNAAKAGRYRQPIKKDTTDKKNQQQSWRMSTGTLKKGFT
jgi:hypothetical protein